MSSTLERAREAVRTMAAQARRRTRLNITVLWIAVAVLAVGPLAITLLRADDYKSSATISFNADNPTATELPNRNGQTAERLVESPLDSTELQKEVAKKVGWFDTPDDLPDFVSVEQRTTDARPVFDVTARGPGADDARELAQVTSVLLNEAADGRARFVRPLELQRLKRTLRRNTSLSEAERAGLQRRRAALALAVRNNQPVFAAQPTEPTLVKERIADRVLGSLPGARPLRPNPLWAAAAGLALALALALWVLVLSSGGRAQEQR